MLPNKPPSPMPTPSPASPMPGAGSAGPDQGGMPPEQVRQAIEEGMNLLKQAADKNGVSTQELMSLAAKVFGGGGPGAPSSMGRPPQPGGARQMPLPPTMMPRPK
jgi:hypothetical protein